MPYIDQNIYTQYTKPTGTGGKVLPVDNGNLYIGNYGQDPAAEDSRVPVYFVDEAQNQIEVPQPIKLSDAGVPTYGGAPFNPFVEVSQYSISVRDKNQTEIFSNKFIGTTQAISLLEAACMVFNLSTEEAGVSVKNLVVGMSMDDVYGLVAPDGSLWINSDITGIVEQIPDPFYGIMTVSDTSVRLIKKRDENRYFPNYDYLTGDVVIGTDNEKYVALVNNGPSYGGSVEPTELATSTWRKPKKGVGAVVMGTSPSLAPFDDLVAADGSEILREDYPDLYTFALTNMADDEEGKEEGQYGPGDGSTTFTVPDFRGLFPRFWDNDKGTDDGREFGTYQEDEIKLHGHPFRVDTQQNADSDGGGGMMLNGDADSNRSAYTGTPSGTLGQQIGGTGGDETRPKNTTVYAWIQA